MNRRSILAAGAAVGCTALLGAVLAPPAAAGASFVTRAPLTDFDTTNPGPFDNASGSLTLVGHSGSSTVVFRVHGIDPAVADQQFGAHLHLGPCVENNGAAALGHYNTDVLAGVTPPRVDETTEVWLDIVVTSEGTGTAVAQVPFVPIPGDRSVVIHALPTDETGAAGARLACLPVVW
jgi:Cu/Zn superoxide dismutase